MDSIMLSLSLFFGFLNVFKGQPLKGASSMKSTTKALHLRAVFLNQWTNDIK